mgnify:CR=1 FL=1
MAEYGHYHWQDTYGTNPNDDKKGSSGSAKTTNTNTAQSVNEEELNKAFNTEVKDRQTSTFKQ